MRDLYFCGDIHGEIKHLVWYLIESRKINKSDVVVCGDYGIGFMKKSAEDELYYKKLHNKLDSSDINIYVLRGNHDNPEWFDGLHDYPRIKFIEDHKILYLSGLKIYPIGGGVSIDRNYRINYNKMKESLGSSKRIWWENERINKVYKFPNKVDIIISHEAPLSFEPVCIRSSNMSLDLWNDILEDRTYLDKAFREIVHSRWFFAHYHTSITGSIENVLYKCLDIDEIYRLN